MNNENKLLTQIVSCGDLIKKKREHFKSKGIDEEMLLKGLSEDEQAEISILLTKMKNYWIEAHKSHHQAQKNEK